MNPETHRSPYLSLGAADSRSGGRSCDHPGCAGAGSYRAPKAPDNLDEHYWFCLDHIRTYNASWDYLKGKSRQDINEFQRSTICWDRPTWRVSGPRAEPGRPTGTRGFGVDDPLGILKGRYSMDFDLEVERRRYDPDGGGLLTPEDRKALAALGLDAEATKDDIKAAYKTLVKRHHPDLAGASPETAARFCQISDSYRHLAAAWQQKERS